ncbi:transposable element Tcb2 transposase [Trichonephila clavipes]|nr:transposable element Tcb2 transposase [Trichonephila clavipes]
MPLRRFRRQYEQLPHFESGRIIGMMEAAWSARPGSGRPRQTSHQVDHHIVRNARVQPTASSAAVQAQVAPSLGPPVSSRTIRRCLAEGHLGSQHPLRVLPLAPITCAALDAHPSTPPFRVVPRTRKLDCSGVEPGRL